MVGATKFYLFSLAPNTSNTGFLGVLLNKGSQPLQETYKRNSEPNVRQNIRGDNP